MPRTVRAIATLPKPVPMKAATNAIRASSSTPRTELPTEIAITRRADVTEHDAKREGEDQRDPERDAADLEMRRGQIPDLVEAADLATACEPGCLRAEDELDRVPNAPRNPRGAVMPGRRRGIIRLGRAPGDRTGSHGAGAESCRSRSNPIAIAMQRQRRGRCSSWSSWL